MEAQDIVAEYVTDQMATTSNDLNPTSVPKNLVVRLRIIHVKREALEIHLRPPSTQVNQIQKPISFEYLHRDGVVGLSLPPPSE